MDKRSQTCGEAHDEAHDVRPTAGRCHWFGRGTDPRVLIGSRVLWLTNQIIQVLRALPDSGAGRKHKTAVWGGMQSMCVFILRRNSLLLGRWSP